MTRLDTADPRSRIDRKPAFALAVFLIAIFLTGGASRPDEPLQIAARLFSLMACAFGAISVSRVDLRAVRTTLTFATFAAALICVQLLPLPPAIWSLLPGREIFGRVRQAAAVRDVWWPISLTPDLTLNALFSLFAPVASILLVSRSRDQSSILRILLTIGGIATTSAIVGLFQLATTSGSYYGFVAKGFNGPSGLFANRNHQALLLACGLPVLAELSRRWTGPSAARMAMGVFAIALLAAIMATGSRAGFLLAAISVTASLLAFPTPLSAAFRTRARIWLVLGACALTGIGVAIASRAGVVSRLLTDDLSQELRLQILRPMLELAWKYFPVGAGFGSFSDVYRIDEPLSALSPVYLNHAHDDWVEIVIGGGLPTLLLLAVCTCWYGLRIIFIFREPESQGVARVASVIVILCAAASVVDYPLRTPALSVLFATALAWIEIFGPRRRQVSANALDTPAPTL